MTEPAYIRDHRRARAEDDARIALLRKIVNTYGFALLAAAVTDPVLKDTPMGLPNYLIGGLALAFHALALYLAPIGKDKADD